MKEISILFIIGIIIALISFSIYKIISIWIEKERKIAEELIRMENGQELLNKQLIHNRKKAIIISILFYIGLGIIAFIIGLIFTIF